MKRCDGYEELHWILLKNYEYAKIWMKESVSRTNALKTKCKSEAVKEIDEEIHSKGGWVVLGQATCLLGGFSLLQ